MLLFVAGFSALSVRVAGHLLMGLIQNKKPSKRGIGGLTMEKKDLKTLEKIFEKIFLAKDNEDLDKIFGKSHDKPEGDADDGHKNAS